MLFAAASAHDARYGALAWAIDLDKLFVLVNTDTHAFAFCCHSEFFELLIATSRNLPNLRSNGAVPFYSTPSPGPFRIRDSGPAPLQQFG